MKKIHYFVPASAFYLLIFLVSSRDYGIDVDSPLLEKGAHAAEFAALSFLLALGFFNVLTFTTKMKVLATSWVGILLGLLDELHQYFVPGRHSDLRDALADAFGVAIGLLTFWLLWRKRKKGQART